MEKLKAAKLYRAALMPISEPLVQRYNECLLMLGFTPTKLTSFSIDGLGWSPEIAEEKQDIQYLNSGEANPNAIIISPEQKSKPVYVPFHSFDRDIMQYIFENYEEEIFDITRDSAICVDLNQYIDAFYEPFDLLKYQNISIGFKLLNDLDKIQQQQLELIRTFNEGHNFIDEDLHLKILASARKYGDLRNRKLNLKNLEYETESFYTRAFGGVFILRDAVKPVMVYESEHWYYAAIKDTTHDVIIFRIDDHLLFEKLRDYLIISYDVEEFAGSERFERVKNHIISEYLEKTDHPIKEILDNQFLYKRYLNSLGPLKREALLSVERFMEKKDEGLDVNPLVFINKEFFKALHKPHSSFTEEQKSLIWQLLVKAAPKDPLYLYWYDKELFYRKYLTWDESYREWVINCITEKI